MPGWWGKKPSKKIPNDNNKPKSFDVVLSPATPSRNSPTSNNNPSSSGSVPGGFSGFSGFDSDSGERRGHPLPRPALPLTFAIDIGVSGSGSISSVSSSGSSDDHPVAVPDQGKYGNFRELGNVKIDMRSRSPGPGSRGGPTSPTLPLHQRLCGFSLDSSDGKSQCHKLPLPPGSPTSPNSPLINVKSIPAGENFHTQSKWKKGKLLGRGTFGHVYLGFNSISGQMCAIKEIQVVSDDNPSKECLRQLNQLNQEINLLSQLSHPNIVQYYGSEMGDEALSVYLEYISGGSIHKLVQEYGPLKEPVIQNYTRKIVSGLAYLHGRNTVHRDIKGANILVDPNGEIKLADFGMARHITNCSSMLSFKGSPYWMAPEVVMNANGYSLAVDIWSLGCTVLEMATSKPPWCKYEGVAAIFKIGNSKEIPEIPNHLSNDAKSFVKLCLQRNVEARPTASQLLDHPFLRDQSPNRVANLSPLNFSMDAFFHSLDGSQTPQMLDHRPNRKSTSTCDRECSTSPLGMTSRAFISSRENIRTITSLHVSPCSSPLRNRGPTYNNCFVSHSYTLTGESRYNLNDFSSYMTRPNMATFDLDPWIESSVLKVQTPSGSPRGRLI